jgi:hypothetical protein
MSEIKSSKICHDLCGLLNNDPDLAAARELFIKNQKDIPKNALTEEIFHVLRWCDTSLDIHFQPFLLVHWQEYDRKYYGVKCVYRVCDTKCTMRHGPMRNIDLNYFRETEFLKEDDGYVLAIILHKFLGYKFPTDKEIKCADGSVKYNSKIVTCEMFDQPGFNGSLPMFSKSEVHAFVDSVTNMSGLATGLKVAIFLGAPLEYFAKSATIDIRKNGLSEYISQFNGSEGMIADFIKSENILDYISLAEDHLDYKLLMRLVNIKSARPHTLKNIYNKIYHLNQYDKEIKEIFARYKKSGYHLSIFKKHIKYPFEHVKQFSYGISYAYVDVDEKTITDYCEYSEWYRWDEILDHSDYILDEIKNAWLARYRKYDGPLALQSCMNFDLKKLYKTRLGEPRKNAKIRGDVYWLSKNPEPAESKQ